MASRAQEIAGRQILIVEHDPSSATSYSGSCIWDCSLVLAHWLDSPSSFPPHSFRHKRVVELGAGTGLPGLVAAALGAQEVVLTDRPALVSGLQRNVDANGLNENVKVQALEWGQDCSSLSPPVDLILMSDLLYDVSAMPQLCKTILDLSDDNTVILLAYELRVGTTDCFRVMREMGLQWSRVPQGELHPQWQSDDIGVFRVSRAV